jgi:hypothetical protein
LIQNTARVQASLYTSNLGPLNAYKRPTNETYGVCWNQMSDRPVPSIQRATIPTGSNTSMNRRHTSVTSSRPGCQTPGGAGVDIKHNSYDRYLNRLKGKGPLRRGVIPLNFGEQVPFNPAFPIYGGKTTKTNLVSGCDCTPIDEQNRDLSKYSNMFPYPTQDAQIYNDPNWQQEPAPIYDFPVGSYVYAKENGKDYYTRAIITKIQNKIATIQFNNGSVQQVTNLQTLLQNYNSNNGINKELTNVENNIYTIQFDNGTIQEVTNVNELLVYFPCNCGVTIDDVYYENGVLQNSSVLKDMVCKLTASTLTNGDVL